MEMNFGNRVVAITGATGGLGRVAARKFSEEGARLVLISRDPEKLSELVKELAMPEDRFLIYAADLGQAATALNILAGILSKFGQVDILIHLVGGWNDGKTVVDVEIDQVSNMLQQHLWTTFHITQAFLPTMLSRRWGRILVVSSPFASNPVANLAPYAIGKAAQEALIQTIAQEVKGSGVTANMLLVKTIDLKHERLHQPTNKNASWTTPEEICSSLLHLSTEGGNRINGARIPLYGNL
jgi:NAD(P)-dependent dehydrogenase (short-subunit alcohol dehydrogenase family)